ncbi:MAG: hypothetical protein PVSMB4_06650 [Ktedonobacterales bacterium]
MPAPRLGRLAPAKCERLLDAAAQESAAHRFEAASINRILARADMSRGATYCDVEDKVGLYFTAVQSCDARLKLFDRSRSPALFTAATCWAGVAEGWRLAVGLAHPASGGRLHLPTRHSSAAWASEPLPVAMLASVDSSRVVCLRTNASA